ncbi:hypothetical protein GA0115246_100919 [Streptomyces sp. SolWspMP-sol7th]|nr:hypothetical protein GA0115246_100919 [Streptomyces sp. SolWspMP-sol7th]
MLTHWIASTPEWRSRARSSSATLTIVESRITAMPPTSTAIAMRRAVGSRRWEGGDAEAGAGAVREGIGNGHLKVRECIL